MSTLHLHIAKLIIVLIPLCFEQSQAHPREIMNEVLKALQELNVCWKKIGHYNMKCRWVPCFADGLNTRDNNQLHFGDDSSIIEDDCAMTSPTVIKFELQVTAHSHTSQLVSQGKKKKNFLVRFHYYSLGFLVIFSVVHPN